MPRQFRTYVHTRCMTRNKRTGVNQINGAARPARRITNNETNRPSPALDILVFRILRPTMVTLLILLLLHDKIITDNLVDIAIICIILVDCIIFYTHEIPNMNIKCQILNSIAFVNTFKINFTNCFSDYNALYILIHN